MTLVAVRLPSHHHLPGEVVPGHYYDPWNDVPLPRLSVDRNRIHVGHYWQRHSYVTTARIEVTTYTCLCGTVLKYERSKPRRA